MNMLYPKRPLKAAFICFALLMAVMAVAIATDDCLQAHWPAAIGYCAMLTFACVGLARLPRPWTVFLIASTAIAIFPLALLLISMLLFHQRLQTTLFPTLDFTLHTSSILLCLVGVSSILLVFHGWWLYFADFRASKR